MSLVLAADYRVPDFDRWWARLSGDLPRLPGLGAHHVVVYRAHGRLGRAALLDLPRPGRRGRGDDLAGDRAHPALFVGRLMRTIEVPGDGG